MNFRIESISDATREEFYKQALEYLPYSDYEKVKKREAEYHQAYRVVLLNEKVIGVAFGWPRRLDVPEDESFRLDGICIQEPFQKNGYGSLLLQAVERACKLYGCSFVSLGSAGGYVEHYYIKNGYMPMCYKFYRGQSIIVEKEYTSMIDYETYQRKNKEGFVVMAKNVSRIK